MVRHEVQEELTIPVLQKFENQIASDIPPGRVDERKGESVRYLGSYRIQIVFELALKDMDLELASFRSVFTKPIHGFGPFLAQIKTHLEARDAILFEAPRTASNVLMD